MRQLCQPGRDELDHRWTAPEVELVETLASPDSVRLVMAMPGAGFVFLSMAKAGSTAIQQHLGDHAQVIARRPPALKHVDARTFEQLWVPVLERGGFARASYELVSLVRDPVDRAQSWWRYRSRPSLAGDPNYAGDLSFDEFAERVVAREVRYRSAHRFVTDAAGEVLVERLWKYEHLDDAVAWMTGQLGIDAPAPPPANVSERAAPPVAPATRAMLEEFFAADVDLHATAR